MAIAPTGTELPSSFCGEEFDELRSRAATAPSRVRERVRLGFVDAFDERDRVYSTTGMVWDRGTCLALSDPQCAYCHGLGQRFGRRRMTVCACVYRACFRQCQARLTLCRLWQEKGISKTSMECARFYSRKVEEYCADFELIARRAIGPDVPANHDRRVFELHLLGGAPWRECAAKIGIDRGKFFHCVYKAQARIGQAFHECEPYALHPVDLYFGRSLRLQTRRPGLEPSPKVASLALVQPDVETTDKMSRAVLGVLSAEKSRRMVARIVAAEPSPAPREPREPLPNPEPDRFDEMEAAATAPVPLPSRMVRERGWGSRVSRADRMAYIRQRLSEPKEKKQCD